MSGDRSIGYGSTLSVNGNGDNSCKHNHSGQSAPFMTSRGGSNNGYEELFKDSVPCPSCRGLGRVPREQESELVALIPMKDKRLKPTRTILYVVIAIIICMLVASLCMFFLFPRDVVINSNRPLLEPLTLDLNVTASYVNFTVMNFYNFSNGNFIPVQITGAQMTAMYDERLMGKAANDTHIEVPIKSSETYGILMTFVFSKHNDWGFLVQFCEDKRPWVHNFPVTFELLANYTYLGHVEQATLTTYQQVSCYNTSDANSTLN